MSHLQVQKPNVYCLRMGKPFIVTKEQFADWFTDNQGATAISKKELNEARKIQLQKGKTICLSTYCNTELTLHNHGYCDQCEDFNQLEYNPN
jgi:hypothetical protein